MFSENEIDSKHSPKICDEFQYEDHARIVREMVSAVVECGWVIDDDVYVLYDCFRARLVYATVLFHLRDSVENLFLKILDGGNNKMYGIIVDFEGDCSVSGEEIDFVIRGEIFTIQDTGD